MFSPFRSLELCTLFLLCIIIFSNSAKAIEPRRPQSVLQGSKETHQTPLNHESFSSTETTSKEISEIIASSPLLSLHRSICSIESTSNHEINVGKYLVSYLRAHGFGVIRQHVPSEQYFSSSRSEERFNILAWPIAQPHSGSRALSDPQNYYSQDDGPDDHLGDFQPRVILTSHIDTVPPYIPYSASASDVYKPVNRSAIFIGGRGTVDAKACVAAQTQAVIELLQTSAERGTGSKGDGVLPVALLFVVSEETVGIGMKFFSGSQLHRRLAGLGRPRAPKNKKKNEKEISVRGEGRRGYSTVIFGEPTESRLCAGHKGLATFQIKVTGRAAHSGYPWLGVDANLMLVKVIEKLSQLGSIGEAEGGLARSEKYGNSTVNLGVMWGGVALNVVSARAEVKGAIRIAGGKVEEAREAVWLALHRLKTDHAGGMEGSVSMYREGNGSEAVGEEDGAGLQLRFFGSAYPPVDLNTEVRDEHGKGSFGEQITVNYGTDVPNLEVIGKGVRRYLYGPGSILVAHGPDEGLTVADLEGSVEGYKVLIEEALKRE